MMNRGQSDLYRNQDDPYRRHDELYRSRDDPYRIHQQVYRESHDPYRGQDDPYRGQTYPNADNYRGDVNRGHNDPYRGHRDPNIDTHRRELNRGQDDPYRGHTDPNMDAYRHGELNRGHDDPYRGHTDPNTDIYRRGEPNQGHDEPYRGHEDTYRSGVSRDELYTKVTRANGHGPYDSDRPTSTNYRDKPPEPLFEVDHLATFIATKRGVSGLITVEEGISKLRSMELMTGIWTMRCHMVIERQHITILDNQTGEEQDRFPIELVHAPTAIMRNDPREIYSNLLLFTAATDPKKGDPEPNMHIFQSVSASCQVIADEIQAAKDGKSRVHSGHNIPPPPMKPAPSPPHPSKVQEQVHNFQRMMSTALSDQRPVPGMYGRNRPMVNKDRDDNDSIHSEKIEMDMRKLNACCDDIEKFVARLQQAAEAFRALEKREAERRKKDPKNRQKQVGDGMLTMRARPPPTNEYIEVFQKFKYAFNILACLKPYIHDPNAPELVHFLFTPLSLICEASRDPRNGVSTITSAAVAPLLTKDAKELLLNCLTTKEQQFWMALGDSWYLTKDQYRGYVPTYAPRFTNGWQPSLSEMDDDSQNVSNAINMSNDFNNYMPGMTPNDDIRTYNDNPRQDGGYDGQYNSVPQQYNQDYQQNRLAEGSIPSSQPSPRPINNNQMRAESNLAFARDLQLRGARLVQVEHARQGKNVKELSVEGGDILEVLESARNWWKLRNCFGEVGHSPYTILKEIRPEDVETRRLSAGITGLSMADRTNGQPLATSSQIHRSNTTQSTGPDPERSHGPVYAVVGKRHPSGTTDSRSNSRHSSGSTVDSKDTQSTTPAFNILYTQEQNHTLSSHNRDYNQTPDYMNIVPESGQFHRFPRPEVAITPTLSVSTQNRTRIPSGYSVSSTESDDSAFRAYVNENCTNRNEKENRSALGDGTTQITHLDVSQSDIGRNRDSKDIRGGSSPVLQRIQMLNNMAAQREQQPEITHVEKRSIRKPRVNSFGKSNNEDVIRYPDFSPIPSLHYMSDSSQTSHDSQLRKRPISQLNIESEQRKRASFIQAEIVQTQSFLKAKDNAPVQPIFDLLHRGQLHMQTDQDHTSLSPQRGQVQHTYEGQGEGNVSPLHRHNHMQVHEHQGHRARSKSPYQDYPQTPEGQGSDSRSPSHIGHGPDLRSQSYIGHGPDSRSQSYRGHSPDSRSHSYIGHGPDSRSQSHEGQRRPMKSPLAQRQKSEPVSQAELTAKEIAEAKPRHSSLQDELRARMNDTAALSHRPRTASQNSLTISDQSSPDDVRQWLMHKAFSNRCIEKLGCLHGDELLRLNRGDLERLLSGEDVNRLDSQLNVQRSLCGFVPEVSNELLKALARRKTTFDDVEVSSVASDDVFTSMTSLHSHDSGHLSDSQQSSHLPSGYTLGTTKTAVPPPVLPKTTRPPAVQPKTTQSRFVQFKTTYGPNNEPITHI